MQFIAKLVEFNNKSRPSTMEGKYKKRDTYKSAYALYEGWEFLTLSKKYYFQ